MNVLRNKVELNSIESREMCVIIAHIAVRATKRSYRTPLMTPIVLLFVFWGSVLANNLAKLHRNEKHCTNGESLCTEPSTMITRNEITILLSCRST